METTMPKKIKDEYSDIDTAELSPLAGGILQGLREALAYKRGHLTEADGVKIHRFNSEPIIVDIKALRKKLKLTQSEFAYFIHASPRAVQHWEQKTRQPEGPTLVLLQVLAQNPQVVWKAIQEIQGESE